MTSFPVSAIILIGCILGCLQTTQCKQLVVSSLLIRPFLTATQETINGTNVVTYEGYIPDLLDELFKLTELPAYKLSVRRDSKFGQRLPNGSWDGLIGDVVDGRADIAAGPLTETAARSEIVDFSTPFMSYGPVVILKRPQTPVMTLEDRLQRLFSPLSQSIWMLSGMAWLITSVILYIICHVNPYEWRRLAKDRQASFREGESFSCLNTFWFTMSNILWQGYTRSPRSMGARVVVTFWWLYVLIFVVMYIASMTNYLRVGPTQESPDSYSTIHGIEDLSQQNEVGYGVIKAGATDQYLWSAKINNIRKLWDKINQHNMYVSSLETAITRVRTSRKPYAFIAESAMAKFYTKQSPCDIYMVGDFTSIGSYALAFRFNSSLVKKMDIAMLMLREKGMLKELEDRWFSGECTGFVVETNKNRMQFPPFYGVDLGTFSGALIILGVGLIIGSLTTGIEVLVFRCAETEDDDKKKSPKPLATSNVDKKAMPVSRMEPQPITDV